MANNPLLRRDKYSTFQTGGITFAIDNGCLLIKVRDDYPMPLTPQATHRLFNILFDHRADIIEANAATSKFGAGQGRRNKKANDYVSSE